MRGEANCSWNETKTVRRNGNDETQTTTYKDHDLYFENHVTLFGGSGKKKFVNKNK
jgi:putative transposon-encoded protein